MQMLKINPDIHAPPHVRFVVQRSSSDALRDLLRYFESPRGHAAGLVK